MKFIAQKPCSFGGNNYYIGDEIPVYLVSSPETQERLGVISILVTKKDEDLDDACNLSWSEVEEKIAEAIKESENRYREAEENLKKLETQLEEAQSYTTELQETETGEYEVVVPIVISIDGDEAMSIMLTPEEIQLVVTIRQQNAENAIKAIAEVKSENALILIHALDERKTVKEAAKKQADTLTPTENDNNEAANGNETVEPNTEGVDA